MRKSILSFFLFAAVLLFAGGARAQGYRATITALVPASSATDIFTLVPTGGTKIVTITKVVVSCTQTTPGAIDLVFLKRSTADTAGTSSTPTIVKLDSQNPTSAASALAYTANPTAGTLVGNLSVYKLNCLGTSTASPEDLVIENFGYLNQGVILRGTGEQFAINLNSQTVTGGSFDIDIEWREN